MGNPSDEVLQWSLEELANAIRERRISPVEVTRALFQSIKEKDGRINAYVTLMEEEAMTAAKRAEEEIAQGIYKGPLHGVPIALKDMINTQGTRTTMGSPIYKDFIPAEDADLVHRLKQAGAVIVGKLNMHQFAFGATGDRSYFGPVRNPHRFTHVTGGSSSGSGAALAAYMAYGTIGTDTGGSVRIPSSCCGVVGMKPTFGSVSKHGVYPLSWTLDHIGPMTRTVRDNALFLNEMVGYDPKDPYSIQRKEEDFARQIGQSVKGMTLGIPDNFYFDLMHPEVLQVYEENVEKLKRRGVQFRSMTIHYMDELMAAHQVIIAAEAYANMEHHVRERSEQMEQEVLTRIVSGAAIQANLYIRMLQIRHLAIEEHRRVLAEVDALMTPTLCILPPEIDQREIEVAGKKEHARLLTRLTAPINALGFPAISVPGGWADGLPVGIQFIGLPFSESQLYRLAYHVEN